MNQALSCLSITVGILGAAAQADIMHWYWEVEVNGQAVDTGQPVVVRTGDHVDIELWAEFDPYREGFAAGHFSIAANDRFFSSGTVTIDPQQGYGLNPYLLTLGENGVLTDSDNSGIPDTLDSVLGFQLARGWGTGFDSSNPIQVYRVGWVLEEPLTLLTELYHGPTLDGDFWNAVYIDDFTTTDYSALSDSLVFIPAPCAAAVLALSAGALLRRRSQ